MSALHHPPLWWWCWLTLMLWGGERIWGAAGWLYLNGFLGSRSSIAPMALTNQKHITHNQGWELRSMFPDVESGSSLSMGRFVPPGRLIWAPGQHFQICIPLISKFSSHPFTVASICDTQKLGNDGRTIAFLIRAKNGWTKDLWTTVVGLLSHGQRHPPNEIPEGTILPTTGVLLKAWVDGPFGSPERTNWSVYSTAVIVAGGSGASFAISVLEYLCLCMAGRDGRSLGGTMGRGDSFSMRRIRFIWILRDFGELSVRMLLEAVH